MTVIRGNRNGHSSLTGGAGSDYIVAFSDQNTISGGGGNDTIIADTGSDNLISVGGVAGDRSVVVLGGADDTVTAGDASVFVRGDAPGLMLTLGTGDDTVRSRGGNAQISIGGGTDSIASGVLNGSLTLRGGNSTITFTNDFVQDYTERVVLSGTGNVVNNELDQIPFPAQGAMTIRGGSGSGTFYLGGATGTLVTGGTGNSITGGFGSDTIWAGSGEDSVYLTGGPRETGGFATVHLRGGDNSVTGQDQNATITGGGGQDTIHLQGEVLLQGGYVIDQRGFGNSIEIDTGVATINAGAGLDTVTFNSSVGTLTFQGSGDVLNLGGPLEYAGMPDATVEDNGQGLRIVEGGAVSGEPSSVGNLTIDHFDTTGVIDFVGQRGGFTDVQQVMQDLTNEGGGSWQIVLPDSSGTITFLNTAQLTASNFAVG